MIKLTKLPIPEILERNHQRWTEELMAVINAGSEPTVTQKSRYRHTDVKEQLLLETNGKCAYCESKVEHVTYGDVEHIVPKSLSMEKSFEWENLTLACDVCNTNKGNSVVNHDTFVDPYISDPQDHFYFAGPLLVAGLGQQSAILTESLLDLNRPKLFERRKEKLRYLKGLMEACYSAPDVDVKRALLTNIRNTDMIDAAEFSHLNRTFLQPLIDIVEADIAA